MSSDEFTLGLLTNPEIIAVNQHSKGNHLVVTNGEEVIWSAKRGEDSVYYVAVFNVSDEAKTFRHSWKEVGFSGKSYIMRDLWKRLDLGSADRLEVTLSPHAACLYQIVRK